MCFLKKYLIRLHQKMEKLKHPKKLYQTGS
jgi:hypothetical protein